MEEQPNIDMAIVGIRVDVKTRMYYLITLLLYYFLQKKEFI